MAALQLCNFLTKKEISIDFTVTKRNEMDFLYKFGIALSQQKIT